MRRADAECALTSQEYSAWNDVTAAILKFGLCLFMRIHLKNNPAKFHHRSELKRRSLGLFWSDCPNKKKNNNNKMRSDLRSVPDQKIMNYCHPLDHKKRFWFGHIAVLVTTVYILRRRFVSQNNHERLHAKNIYHIPNAVMTQKIYEKKQQMHDQQMANAARKLVTGNCK